MKCCRRFRPMHVTDAEIERAVAALRGDIDQVPSAVSAIKVDGQRAYKLAREGSAVELAARRVRIARFDVARGPARRRRSSTSTSRWTARRAPTSGRWPATSGAALGVGGHLTALRRTRVGDFGLDEARTLDELADAPRLSYSLDEACLLGVSAARALSRGGCGIGQPRTGLEAGGHRRASYAATASGRPGDRAAARRRRPDAVGGRRSSRHAVADALRSANVSQPIGPWR